MPPEAATVEKGARAEFKCFAFGIPEPTILWMLNQEVVNTGSILVIDPVGDSDEGTYVCGAINGNGEPATASAILTTYGKLQVHRIAYMSELFPLAKHSSKLKKERESKLYTKYFKNV